MALTATYNAYPSGQARLQNVTALFGTIAATGNYTTGGVALSLPEIPGYDTTQVVDIFIHGIAGYVYSYDISNTKVLVYESAATAAPLAEISAAAFPSGVTGDTITFVAYVLNHG